MSANLKTLKCNYRNESYLHVSVNIQHIVCALLTFSLFVCTCTDVLKQHRQRAYALLHADTANVWCWWMWMVHTVWETPSWDDSVAPKNPKDQQLGWCLACLTSISVVFRGANQELHVIFIFILPLRTNSFLSCESVFLEFRSCGRCYCVKSTTCPTVWGCIGLEFVFMCSPESFFLHYKFSTETTKESTV